MSYPILFLGTPDFAAEHLKALVESSDFEVKAVVTQPDRPSGRKMKLHASPVKKMAEEYALPVLTPESAKSSEFIGDLKKYSAQAAVVVAYGQILTQEFLDSFDGKVVNVHGSLLPQWRGAAPIQRSLMTGNTETGVSLQLMVKKLDAGAVLGVRKIKITDEMDALSLLKDMSTLGVDLLLKEFKAFLQGELKGQEQDESAVTYAHKIEKSEALVDWSLSAREIFNRHRGLQMGPGSRTLFGDKGLKLKKISLVNENRASAPGQVLLAEGNQLHIGTGKGVISIDLIQPESRAAMSIDEFLRGYSVKEGDCFGQ